MKFVQVGRLRGAPVAVAVLLSVLSAAYAHNHTSAQPPAPAAVLTLEEAVRLSLAQASVFQQARLAELIAQEDVRQARLAFLPKLEGTLSETYNSPEGGPHAPGSPSVMSFINANAITEHLAVAGMTGDLDVSGRLRATLKRNVALLEAAHAGTEVARRALVQGVSESYYGVSLAGAKRRAAELSLAAAEEFEGITQGLFNAGEVAEVDLTRAKLQTATRRDELQQSQSSELGAQDALRVFVGYDFSTPIAPIDLNGLIPDLADLNRFTTQTIATRSEFAHLSAEKNAAEPDRKTARAERRPRVSYFVDGGFDSDSLGSSALERHSGVLAGVTITVPIFDWGISRSRERQAELRAETVESERILALRTFGQQFNTALAQARVAAARFELLQTSVAQAARNVQTSIARYRAGEAAILEVTDAQTTLASQRVSMVQATFDYQIAR